MSRSLVPAGLLLIAMSYGLARFAYGLFLPEIRADLALTATLSGIIGSGSYLGYCLSIVASAFAIARYGPRRVAVAAGTVATTGMLAIAMSPSPAALAFAVLFAGMSTGLASPPMADAVATVIAQDRQSLANTVINSGTSAGIALSGPIALIATGYWRAAYLFFALIALFATIWVACATPAATAVGTTAVGHTTHRMRLGQLARRDALPVMLAATGMGFASAACWLFGREIMDAVGGLSAHTTSIAWVVIGVPVSPVRSPAPLSNDSGLSSCTVLHCFSWPWVRPRSAPIRAMRPSFFWPLPCSAPLTSC